MEKKQITKKNDLKEKVIEILIRMWGAGAVCYFIAFGTSLGEVKGDEYLVPLILTLGIGLWIFNYLVIDRIVHNMLRTNVNKRPYLEQSLLYRVSKNIGMIFGNIGIVVVIAWFYYIVNTFLLNNGIVGENGKGALYFEPILFGILYGVVYLIIQTIVHLITDKIHKIRESKI